MEITLPFQFQPRPYQIPALQALDNGYKRIITIWHRRSGKDKTWFNAMAKKSQERVGAYYYLFPTYAQGEKILWLGIDRDGFKFTDHIPQILRKRTDNGAMLIEMKNGSLIHIIGTDKVDSLVGTNPVGCVFSEFPLQNPNAWGFLRPILAENGGWAVFNYTPRGKMNQGWDLFQMAKEDPKHWFSEVLTVADTKVVSEEILEQEKREIISQYGDDSLFRQEYYCSFEAALLGSYYANQFKQAETEKRFTKIPIEPTIPVDTWWDLGVGDAMAIWFTQSVSKEVRVVDYYEASGEGFPFYAKVLQEKGYVYGTHNAPHDIRVKEMGSGVTRLETAQKLGIKFQIVKNIDRDDGINAVRMFFSKCWFDMERCKQGLNALANYHKEYDEKRKEYKNTPYHDWSSHAADAFRYLAVGHRSSPVKSEQKRYESRLHQKGQGKGYSLKMV